ncbi:unnamed protein product [Rhodiola kirilowii]
MVSYIASELFSVQH